MTGSLLGVEVEDNMALAAVVYSRRELEQGDHVELQGPELQGGSASGDGPAPDAAGSKAEGRASAGRDGNSAEADTGFKFGK